MRWQGTRVSEVAVRSRRIGKVARVLRVEKGNGGDLNEMQEADCCYDLDPSYGGGCAEELRGLEIKKGAEGKHSCGDERS